MEKRKWVQGHHLRKCHAIKNHLLHLSSLRPDPSLFIYFFFCTMLKTYNLLKLQKNSIMLEQNLPPYNFSSLILVLVSVDTAYSFICSFREH